jgi:ribosomal protein S10
MGLRPFKKKARNERREKRTHQRYIFIVSRMQRRLESGSEAEDL